jgi:hypothetical protein
MAGTGTIVAAGEIVGFGFPLTTRVAITAAHVVHGLRAQDLAFVPDGAPEVLVDGVDVSTDLDVAVLRLAADVPAYQRWTEPRKKASWSADARWLANDPLLVGDITTPRRAIRLQDGRVDVEAIQLEVSQKGIGDFAGYSGCPVVDDQDQVIGVLVEQLETRSDAGDPRARKPAADVLYAIPVRDVVEHFGLASQPARPADDAVVSRLRGVAEMSWATEPNSTPWTEEFRFANDVPGSIVEQVAFSPDGGLLATTGNDGKLRLWSLADDDLVAELPFADRITQLRFSAGGTRLVTASGKQADVWSVPELGRVADPCELEYDVRDVAISPDGRLVAVAGGRGRSLIRDVENGTSTQLDAYVSRLDFSPDGRRFAAFSHSTGIRLWRLVRGELRRGVPVEAPGAEGVSQLRFSQSGQWLITVAAEKPADPLRLTTPRRVWVHQAHAGRRVGSILHDNEVNQVVTSADDELLGSVSSDQTARVWRIGSAAEPAVIRQSTMAHGIGFAPDGSFVAVATWHQDAQVWPLRDEFGPELLPHDDVVRALAVSRDHLIATAARSTATVWRRSP